MNITDYFQLSRDLVSGIPQEYSVPNCTSLIVVQRRASSGTTYLEIDPQPMIDRVNPRMIEAYEGVSSIQFELDDLQTVISGKYEASQVFGRGISYIIGGELIGGVPSGGYEADYVKGTNIRRRSLDWEIILRRRA